MSFTQSGREAASPVEKLKTVAWAVTMDGVFTDNIFASDYRAVEKKIELDERFPKEARDIIPLTPLDVAEAKIAGLESTLALALPRLEEFLETLEDNDLEPQDAPNTSGVEEAIEAIRSLLPASPVNEGRE